MDGAVVDEPALPVRDGHNTQAVQQSGGTIDRGRNGHSPQRRIGTQFSSVLRQLREKSLPRDEARGRANLALLTEPHEEVLLAALSRYPDVVKIAALA